MIVRGGTAGDVNHALKQSLPEHHRINLIRSCSSIVDPELSDKWDRLCCERVEYVGDLDSVERKNNRIYSEAKAILQQIVPNFDRLVAEAFVEELEAT